VQVYQPRLVKIRWRKHLRRWIRHRILDKKEPKNVKVLCLPTSKGIEITDVYDRLNIPRRNIWAVERNKGEFQLLKSSFPDINLYQGNVFNFLKETTLSFDVLSLDLQGHFTRECVTAFDSLFRNRIIGKRGLLVYTFMVGRENPNVRGLMSVPLIVDMVREIYRIAHGALRFSAGHSGRIGFTTNDIGSQPPVLSSTPDYKKLYHDRDCIDMCVYDIAIGVYGFKAKYILGLQKLFINKEPQFEFDLESPAYITLLDELLNYIGKHVDKIMYNNSYRQNIYYMPWGESFLYRSGYVTMKTTFGLFECINEYLKVVPEKYWEINLIAKCYAFPGKNAGRIEEPLLKTDIIRLIKEGSL